MLGQFALGNNMWKVLLLFPCIAVLLCTGISTAGDLSDGISLDDGFSYGDTLKKKTNSKFYQSKAQRKAKQAREDDVVIDAEDGDVNVGSVVDSDVKGDVIILMDDVDTTIKQ